MFLQYLTSIYIAGDAPPEAEPVPPGRRGKVPAARTRRGLVPATRSRRGTITVAGGN